MIIYQNIFKPLIDRTMAVIILMLLSPIFFSLLGVKVFFYGTKVFYVQDRIGMNCKRFKIIKFRTMNLNRDENGKLLADKIRVTKIGKVLRYLSLDEIPNLLNIVTGQMSFIGPRPLPYSFLELMTENQKLRFKVKPGITGLAQVNGRDSIGWSQKFKYDNFYVENVNFMQDFKILVKTFISFYGKNHNIDLGNQSFEDFNPDFSK